MRVAGLGLSSNGFRSRRRLAAVLVGGLGALGVAPSAARTDGPPSARPPGSIRATISSSAADRLTAIVTPAQVRPGQSVNVRVTDTQGRGDVRARVCAAASGRPAECRSVRLRARQVTLRVRVRLARAGRWTLSVRSPGDATLRRRVDVRPRAGLRVLVTGDSMVFGTFEVLGRLLAPDGATVRGDPHLGTGITKPLLDWPAHARAFARSVHPDVTFLMLGAANDSRPLRAAGGATVTCCDGPWIAAYSRRVAGMMASYLRGGRSLVYYALLPAPRLPPDNPRKAQEFRAVNAAIRAAAARFPDGVRVIDEIAAVIAPGGEYRESIRYNGNTRTVRQPDGVHLARAGVHIEAAIIKRLLRADGMTP